MAVAIWQLLGTSKRRTFRIEFGRSLIISRRVFAMLLLAAILISVMLGSLVTAEPLFATDHEAHLAVVAVFLRHESFQ